MGRAYYEGKGVPQDYQQAVKWFTKAAEQGHAIAQSTLGLIYYKGHGFPQDYQQAMKWCTKAAEQGDAAGQFGFGLMYYQGKGVPQDYQQAAKWVTKAAEQGYIYAQVLLGLIYYKGEGLPQDYQQAVKWYTQAAEQVDVVTQYHVVAQYNLGVIYDEGKGVPQDYQQAVKWYTKAAEQGYVSAQDRIAEIKRKQEASLSPKATNENITSSSGASTKLDAALPDAESNLYILKGKAMLGSPEAQLELANRYYANAKNGAIQDYQQAAEWFTKAAVQGNSQAQFSLVTLYHYGRGVPQSDDLSNQWLKKSLEQENPEAQFLVGTYYLTGSNGFPQSDKEAAALFEKSAKQGNEMAANALKGLAKNMEDPCYRLINLLDNARKIEREDAEKSGRVGRSRCKINIMQAETALRAADRFFSIGTAMDAGFARGWCLKGIEIMRTSTCRAGN